jgi:hypothetical protein
MTTEQNEPDQPRGCRPLTPEQYRRAEQWLRDRGKLPEQRRPAWWGKKSKRRATKKSEAVPAPTIARPRDAPIEPMTTQQLANTPVWRTLAQRLPVRPYCADDPSHGLLIRGRARALEHAHIQLNDPLGFRWIVGDYDGSDAGTRWEDVDLPAPNGIAINPNNGHGHYLYALQRPVIAERANGRRHPLSFLSAIERGLTRKMGFDPAYRGLIAKNPASKRWRMLWLTPMPYPLSELYDRLTRDEMRPVRDIERSFGVGRNCTLFDEVRAVAYREFANHQKNGGSFDGWLARLVHVAKGFNAAFSVPLSEAEVRGIAKSIARWTWRHFDHRRFSAVQSNRAKRLGVKRAAIIAPTIDDIARFK